MMNKRLLIVVILLLSLIPAVGARPEPIKYTPNVRPAPINWSGFWAKFNKYADWGLEWYDGSQWVEVKEDLTIIRDYPTPNEVKLTLVFDASHAGDYRLTFGINKVVRSHISKLDQYQYSLTYDNMSLVFDWSDAIEIPGISFSHGVLNKVFLFRMQRNNVPLGAHVEIDPIILIESYTGDGNNRVFNDNHPAGPAPAVSAWGQSFQAPETFTLTNFTVQLQKANNPTCNLTAYLYAHNNTLGVNSTCTGAALATSDSLNATAIGVGWAEFIFNFTDRYQLFNGTDYCIVLQTSAAGTVDGANPVRILTDNTAPTHAGNAIYYQNGAWEPLVTDDLWFEIWGETPWGDAGDLIDDAFEFFNITGVMTQFITYVNGLQIYFVDSITNSLALIVQQFRIVSNIFTWTLRWVTRFIDIILAMGAMITGLLDGTGAVTTAIGNWWTYFELADWYELVVVVCVLVWIDSIARRGETQGEVKVFFEDIGTITNILSYFLSLFSFVVNTIVDMVFRLFDAIV